MYGRWFPRFLNVQRHIDDSSFVSSPKEVASVSKNYLEKISCHGCWISHNDCATDRSFPAYRSKSDTERSQHSGNYAVKNYSSWTYVVHIFLLAYAVSQSAATDHNRCSPGLITPGRTWPSGDIILEHGQPLRIYCILDDNLTKSIYRGKNASDIVFYRGSTLVDRKYITVVNETTSMIYIEQLPASNDMYYCKLTNGHGNTTTYEAVCLNVVTVGFKPVKPRSFECVSYNWERLVCIWEPAPNYLRTRFSLRFYFPGRSGRRSLYRCPGPLKTRNEYELEPNMCLLDSTTDPIYRQSQPYFVFRLDATNALGNETFSYNFDHFANVIPAKPVDLSIINKTSSSALLHWSVPYPMDAFPVGLSHRIMYRYRNQHQPPNSWTTIDTMTSVRTTKMYFNLSNLEYANAVHDVRVSLKSSKANREDMWGQYSELNFKTAPNLPGQSPKADTGSFEIIGNRDRQHRDVFVYWQSIPAYLENGDNFTYKITGIEDAEHGLTQTYETTKTHAKFTGISFNNFRFEIIAVNCIGANHGKATVHVPRQFKMPQKPVPFAKIAFEGGVYELSWYPTSNSDVINYTIFFCENERDRPYQCTGYLDWIHVSGNTRMFNMTVPDSEKVYQFAIAANTAYGSSGMAWFSGTTILSDEIRKMQSVRINRIESNLIELGWELEYFDRIGIVQNIEIYHCPITSSYNFTCRSPKMVTDIGGDFRTTHKVLQDLEPITTYMITVALISKNGPGLHSDLLYVTTLSAPPDTPSSFGSLSVPSPINVPFVIADRSFDISHFIAGPNNRSDETLGNERSRIGKSYFDQTDCYTQHTSLVQTISELNDTIKDLTDKSDLLNKKLSQYNEVGSCWSQDPATNNKR